MIVFSRTPCSSLAAFCSLLCASCFLYAWSVLLSVIILQTNKPHDAEACLRSLQKADLPASTEILMINNGGHDANAQIDPSTYVGLPVACHELPRDGYIYGNNWGYAHAAGDYIATVNADITLEPDTIMRLLQYAQQHDDAGIVAPRLFYPWGHEQDSARPFPRMRDLVRRRLFGDGATIASAIDFGDRDAIESDWITGAVFLMPRRCYVLTGGHDSRYFLFMSDITLCREAWGHGLRTVILRDARAQHNEKRLSRGSLFAMLVKKTGRAHILDSLKYFVHYAFKSFPPRFPSGGGHA